MGTLVGSLTPSTGAGVEAGSGAGPGGFAKQPDTTSALDSQSAQAVGTARQKELAALGRWLSQTCTPELCSPQRECQCSDVGAGFGSPSFQLISVRRPSQISTNEPPRTQLPELM